MTFSYSMVTFIDMYSTWVVSLLACSVVPILGFAYNSDTDIIGN